MLTREQLFSANATVKKTDFDNNGKPFAPASELVKAYRLVCPRGSIETSIMEADENHVVMSATIKNEAGEIIATGSAAEVKSDSRINQTSMLENCETGALGRALRFCGFGLDSINKNEVKSLAEANAPIKTVEIHDNPYPCVAERVGAFRSLYPNGSIQTSIVSISTDCATFEAKVYDNEGVLLSTAHACKARSFNAKRAKDYVECCETAAVGRALSSAGFGITVSLASAEEMEYAEAMTRPATEEQKKVITDLAQKVEASKIEKVYQKYQVTFDTLDEFSADKVAQTFRNIIAQQEQATQNANDVILAAAQKQLEKTQASA